MSKSEELNEIAKIREIVFGSQMQTYAKKFEQIENSFTEKLDNFTVKFEKEQSKTNSSLSKDKLETLETFKVLRDDIKLICKEHKDSLAELKKLTSQTDEENSKNFNNIILELKEEFQNYKKESKDTLLKAQFENDKKITELRESHLSHDEFSEALLELSSRFSNTNSKSSETHRLNSSHL